MAARLTDRQKKKILADYLESGSYRATARKNNVNPTTVKRVVEASDDFEQKAAEKKHRTRQTFWRIWRASGMWCARSSEMGWRC